MSNGFLSFVITLALYIVIFLSASLSGGDESNNPAMAAAAFLAMTFFINFPVAWFITYKLVKALRNYT